MLKYLTGAVAASLVLAGCTNTTPVVPPIAAVQGDFQRTVNATLDAGYTLGPADVVAVRTFQEPDLSFDELVIDDAGAISFPLIGTVQAEGLTAQQFADQIESKLAARYLQNPDVSVTIKEANSRKVVIEGAVARPGIFGVSNSTTLLGALALASGPTEYASLDDVVIFRTIDGQKMGAVFDLSAIRRGAMDDPQILANDTVVVNISNGRKLYQDFLRAAPLVAAVFRPVTS